ERGRRRPPAGTPASRGSLRSPRSGLPLLGCRPLQWLAEPQVAVVAAKDELDHLERRDGEVHALPTLRPDAVVKERYQLLAGHEVQPVELGAVVTLVVHQEPLGRG